MYGTLEFLLIPLIFSHISQNTPKQTIFFSDLVLGVIMFLTSWLFLKYANIIFLYFYQNISSYKWRFFLRFIAIHYIIFIIFIKKITFLEKTTTISFPIKEKIKINNLTLNLKLFVIFFLIYISCQVITESFFNTINKKPNIDTSLIFLISYVICFLLNIISIFLEKLFFNKKIILINTFILFILYLYIITFSFVLKGNVYLFILLIISFVYFYILNNLIKYIIQIKFNIYKQNFILILQSTAMTLSSSISLSFPIFLSDYLDINLTYTSVIISIICSFIVLFFLKHFNKTYKYFYNE